MKLEVQRPLAVPKSAEAIRQRAQEFIVFVHINPTWDARNLIPVFTWGFPATRLRKDPAYIYAPRSVDAEAEARWKEELIFRWFGLNAEQRRTVLLSALEEARGKIEERMNNPKVDTEAKVAGDAKVLELTNRLDSLRKGDTHLLRHKIHLLPKDKLAVFEVVQKFVHGSDEKAKGKSPQDFFKRNA